MQIGFNSNIQQINNNLKIDRKKSNPINFCGNDSLQLSPEAKFEKDTIKLTNMLFSGERVYIDQINSALENDTEIKKLNQLANNYKSSKSLQDKVELLKHEEKMLWQELEKPHIGLIRNFEALVKAGRKRDDIMPAVKISALNGLGRTLQAYDKLNIQYKKDDSKPDILKKVIKDTSDKDPYAKDIKMKALSIGSRFFSDKNKLSEFLKFVIENTEIKEVKAFASKRLSENQYKEEASIKKLSDVSATQEEKRNALVNLGSKRSTKLTQMLPSMIKNNKLEQPLQVASVWAAGRCQSEESFQLLHKISNNNKERNLELREMALHSLSLYLRKHKIEVKQTLNNVINEKSELSDLAKILLEKSEGRYNIEDKELNNLKMSEEEKADYKKTRDQYAKLDHALNIKDANWTDRALAPSANALKTVTNKGSRAHIVNDTMTRIITEDTGKREFVEDALYGGHFTDSITGINCYEPLKGSTIIISEKSLNDKTKCNVLAHEFNHNFLCDAMEKIDIAKLNYLYEKAKKEGKCLDDYAALNKLEYFAQGYEAYATVYKPHSAMIDNNDYLLGGFSHVRSTLKRKDPELYNFIKYCIEKYGKTPANK